MKERGCFKIVALCLLAAVAIFQLTGCATATPAGRAQKNPQILSSLSAADQELVLRGTISEGMSKDAVYVALGRPDAVTTGSENGRRTETWRYTTLQPVYHNYAGFGYGFGYGRWWRRGGYYYPHAGFSLTPDYIPVTSSVVRFRNGKVMAWEMARR